MEGGCESVPAIADGRHALKLRKDGLWKDKCGNVIAKRRFVERKMQKGHCGKVIVEGFLFNASKSCKKFLKSHDEDM